jgi:hypothetical protein
MPHRNDHLSLHALRNMTNYAIDEARRLEQPFLAYLLALVEAEVSLILRGNADGGSPNGPRR